MSSTNQKQKRRTVRLKNYDYSQNGFYFITICTWEHKCILGRIENSRMILSGSGITAKEEWLKTEILRNNVGLKEFIIMPNHMHGIIELSNVNDINRSGTARRAQLIHDAGSKKENFGSPTKNSIPTMIRSYKSAVTKQIREQAENPDLKVW